MPSFIDKLAWLHLYDGRLLSTRSQGKDVYYIPGGKREPGESDWQALSREIREELSVDLQEESLRHAGTFVAQAHGHAEGVVVRMSCFWAGYVGEIKAAAEIAEVVWLSYADRPRVSPVDQLIFDWLRNQGISSRPTR